MNFDRKNNPSNWPLQMLKAVISYYMMFKTITEDWIRIWWEFSVFGSVFIPEGGIVRILSM